jgi:hypothetical protein
MGVKDRASWIRERHRRDRTLRQLAPVFRFSAAFADTPLSDRDLCRAPGAARDLVVTAYPAGREESEIFDGRP